MERSISVAALEVGELCATTRCDKPDRKSNNSKSTCRVASASRGYGNSGNLMTNSVPRPSTLDT